MAIISIDNRDKGQDDSGRNLAINNVGGVQLEQRRDQYDTGSWK